jgi:hypothetical protein
MRIEIVSNFAGPQALTVEAAKSQLSELANSLNLLASGEYFTVRAIPDAVVDGETGLCDANAREGTGTASDHI